MANKYPFIDAIQYREYMTKYASMRKLFKGGTWKFLWLGAQS